MRFRHQVWPEGTVLLFGIRYNTGSVLANGKVYTFVALKANDQWHFSGHSGPQAAGWGAVERWLERDGRELVWVREVTETEQIWPEPPAPKFTTHHLDGSKTVVGGDDPDSRGDMSPGSDQ